MKGPKNWNVLTPQEAYVIENKGTERPFTGEYNNNKAEGIYICRRCESPLYRSEDKFDSRCGWPSANCNGHLGHVFSGDRFTAKNTRHCVNSLSMKFIPLEEWEKMDQPKKKDI
mgnify:CR=1 FL=1